VLADPQVPTILPRPQENRAGRIAERAGLIGLERRDIEVLIKPIILTAAPGPQRLSWDIIGAVSTDLRQRSVVAEPRGDPKGRSRLQTPDSAELPAAHDLPAYSVPV